MTNEQKRGREIALCMLTAAGKMDATYGEIKEAFHMIDTAVLNQVRAVVILNEQPEAAHSVYKEG